MTSTDIDIEKLQKVVSPFKKYDEIRDKTRLEKILAQEEKKFSDLYKEINLNRSNEINPLTACAHGTRADAILFGIIFSGGQLLPLNEIKKVRVLDVHNCRAVGNQNFVSTVHLKNVQDFRNEHQNEIKERGEERRQIIYKNEEISFEVANSYAQEEKSKIFNKGVFLNRIKNRCEGNKNIYNAISDALDDDVLKYFEELSKIHVIALGHGMGKFEGDLDGGRMGYRLTWNRPRETLFERFNISIIAVKKEDRELIEPLTKINTDLNIEIIDQEELLKFTEEYNTQFYDESTTDEENNYYNTDCDNTTRESFMEALVKRFKLSLIFSKEVPPVTITKRSIYKNQGVIGRFDKVSYCIKGLEEKQKFYDEGQVKNAVSKGEKIDDYDPIVYALLSNISLGKKSPILYAMENTIKIEGMDPTLWAQKNKYLLEGKKPIIYAMHKGIKIENKDPILWAHGSGYTIETIDPIVYALGQYRIEAYGKRYQYKYIKIEGKDAKEWISDAINSSKKIGGKDARKWLVDAIKEATEKEGFIPINWRNYPFELVGCAEENNITLEGKPIREWLYDKEAERKNPNKHAKKEVPSPTVGTPITNPISIAESVPAIKQPQEGPAIAEVPSPTLDVPTPEEDSKPGIKIPVEVIKLETEVKKFQKPAIEQPQSPALDVPTLEVRLPDALDGADEEEDDKQSQPPTPVAHSDNRSSQFCFPKLNWHLNWYYIGICSSVCLGLGLVIAGALGLTGGVAAAAIVGSIIFGAVLGGLIGKCVSDPEVSQPNNGLKI